MLCWNIYVTLGWDGTHLLGTESLSSISLMTQRFVLEVRAFHREQICSCEGHLPKPSVKKGERWASLWPPYPEARSIPLEESPSLWNTERCSPSWLILPGLCMWGTHINFAPTCSWWSDRKTDSYAQCICHNLAGLDWPHMCQLFPSSLQRFAEQPQRAS